MALPARPMHAPAGLSIDESTRLELLDVGKSNRSNVNARVDERGALTKRLGFTGLSKGRLGASDRSTGRRLFAHNGVPTVIDGTYIDSYIESAAVNVTRSRVSECTYRTIGAPTPSTEAVLYDVEHCAGFCAIAYGRQFAGVCAVAVVEVNTGAVVRSPETIGAGDGIVFVTSFSDRYFVAFVSVTSATSITAYILDTSNLAAGWTTLATVAASGANGAGLSVCSLEDRVAVAYGTTTGTDRIVVKTYNASGLVQSTTVPTSSTTSEFCNIHGSVAGTLWVAWDQGTAVKVKGLDADLLSSTLASTATVLTMTDPDGFFICEGAAAGTARILAMENASPPATMKMCDITTVAGVTTPGAATTVYNVVPRSRPFQQGGRYYMVCCDGGQTQNLCIVADWTDNVSYLRPVGNVDPGLVLIILSFCKVAPVRSTGRWLYAYQAVKSGTSSVASLVQGNTSTTSTLLELDFASRDRWQTTEHANSTFLGGALLSVYDGERATEAGILLRPTQPTGTLGSTGITGSFRCVAIYEDVDASGNWIVSGISDPSATVSPANQTITWSTASLTISSRIAKGTTRVAFYRTKTGGEPPYYRLTAVSNSTASGTVSYADATSDSTLGSHAKLYAPNLPSTAGESLNRLGPPGLVHLVSYNGMLVGAKDESLIYSGQEVYGEATWFSPVFEVPITGGGGITGLRAMDGTLYVFKSDRIFAVAGEAPSDNGLQGGIGTPRLLATDVGCVSPDSLLVTSLGIFFQSDRGIELLTRSQAVEYIGEPVKETVATYPVVTSAVLDDRNGLARFSLTATDASGVVSGQGRDVIFDLVVKAWVSVDDKYGANAHEPSQSAAQVYVDGSWRYAWLSSTGTIYTEKDSGGGGDCLDGDQWVTLQWELPPWKLGLQQEQRIYEMELLVDRHESAGIKIEFAHNYGGYGDVEPDKEWISVGPDTRQLPFRPVPRGTAVQMRVSDIAPDNPDVTGSGRGFSFIGISADIAPKQGPTRGTTRLNPELRR